MTTQPQAEQVAVLQRMRDEADAYDRTSEVEALTAAIDLMQGQAVDWRWNYRFVTMMRAIDNGLDRPTAERYADNDAASLERAAAPPAEVQS